LLGKLKASSLCLADCSDNHSLTARQIEVLDLMARGLSNKSIAKTLAVAEGTVKLHVAAILRAWGVSNRTQAVTEASQLGLLHNKQKP
jgi:DNA-binding NarL/FixJ family response regulator